MNNDNAPEYEDTAEGLAGQLRLLAAFKRKLKADAPHLASMGNVWLNKLAERLSVELRNEQDAPKDGRRSEAEQSFRIALFDRLLEARTGMRPGLRAEKLMEAAAFTPDQIRKARRLHGALAKKMVTSGPGWDDIRAHPRYLNAVPETHRARLRKLLSSPRKN